MNYEEWQNLIQIEDKQYPLVNLYKYSDGSMFYIEPPFYTQLQGMKMHHPQSFQKIISEMERLVKINKKVIFCYDFENPYIDKKDFIYIEINDITDPLKIFVEDKSRGSDYGD